MKRIHPKLEWLFEGLSRSSKSVVLELLEDAPAKAGEVLLTLRERSECLHFVLAGEVEVTRGDARLSVKGPGDFFGELGFVDPGPATATCVARTDVERAILTHQGLVRLRNEQPLAAARLLTAISRDLAVRIRASSPDSAQATDGADASAKPPGRDPAALLAAAHGGGANAPEPSSPFPAATTTAAAAETLRRLRTMRPPNTEDAAYSAALRQDLELVARLFPMAVRTVPDGTVLCRTGDPADGVYVIFEGEVRILVPTPDGPFDIGRGLGAGESVGLLAFLGGGTRSADCVARGPTTLLHVPARAMQVLLAAAAQGFGGVYLLDWFARQVVSDARASSDRLDAEPAHS